MKIAKYILPILILLAACDPVNQGNKPSGSSILGSYDSTYVIADLQWHHKYYPNLECEVFSTDLLSDGLEFDSAHHIIGSGLNLYISDIFLPSNTTTLQDGTYRMDTTAQPYTFLPYMYFEDGNITGCYMLDIQENKIQRIIGFTAGEMTITTEEDDILLDIVLFLEDSTSRYHATYQGPAIYR